ncbi:MAG: DNA cytosine methyltransferase [Elusimicrobia bacterium]|nr:DNA cytosine methyltransferase [Elusimicrobiota bacterium]
MADLILGHEPIAAVEWDPYCCQILRERAAEGWFPGLQVFEGDIRLFDASAWKGRVDCVSAGFPCQPHSVAGKRRGALDDRNLWPEVVRVLGEIRPRWFFGENVPGLVSNGFIGTVLGDLALLGYDARWTCLGADQVGAPHRRDRWWCLANATGKQTLRDRELFPTPAGWANAVLHKVNTEGEGEPWRMVGGKLNPTWVEWLMGGL